MNAYSGRAANSDGDERRSSAICIHLLKRERIYLTPLFRNENLSSSQNPKPHEKLLELLLESGHLQLCHQAHSHRTPQQLRPQRFQQSLPKDCRSSIKVQPRHLTPLL